MDCSIADVGDKSANRGSTSVDSAVKSTGILGFTEFPSFCSVLNSGSTSMSIRLLDSCGMQNKKLYRAELDFADHD